MPDPDTLPIIGPYFRAATPEERSQIPILGEVEGAMNAIVDFKEYGCYPNWTVWVDTLWPCLGQAFIALFDFGIGDILRGYFRPTHIRGAGGLTRKPVRKRRARAGKRDIVRRISTPPEIGNSIGKSLPGSTFFRARKVTGAERLVWTIDMGFQRLFWYWLVIGIVSEFIQCWSSAIMKSEACARDTGGTVSATRSTTGPWAPDTWHAVLGWATQHDETGGAWNPINGTITVAAGKRCTITFYGDFNGWAGGLNDGGQLAASPTDAGGEPISSTPWPVGMHDNPQEITQTAIYTGPLLIHLAAKAYGTGLQGAHDLVMTAQLTDIL